MQGVIPLMGQPPPKQQTQASAISQYTEHKFEQYDAKIKMNYSAISIYI